VDPTTWIWADERLNGTIIFQLLLDDLIWARGENLMLEAGRRIELTPDFEWPEIPRNVEAAPEAKAFQAILQPFAGQVPRLCS
jgi:hypothetical protein